MPTKPEVQCKVPGCGAAFYKESSITGRQLCQTHYFASLRAYSAEVEAKRIADKSTPGATHKVPRDMPLADRSPGGVSCAGYGPVDNTVWDDAAWAHDLKAQLMLGYVDQG